MTPFRCEVCAAFDPDVPCVALPGVRFAAGNPRRCELAALDPARYAPGIAAASIRHAERPPPAPPAVATIPADDFVTTARLVADATALASRVPPDVDAVVGVPRSGLIPAALLAALRHVPMYQLADGQVVPSGGGWRISDHPGGTPRHVLIVDDTAAMGHKMREALPAVQARWPGVRATRCVVYCHPQAGAWVDLCAAYYPGLHYLEWNWNNAGHGQACGYDFDGILCRDFAPAECATEDAYRAAMREIEPLYLPKRRPIPLIVTARPESCRDLTEAWLDRHGVQCERLVMRDFPAPAADWAGVIGRWKAGHYAASDLPLFAESCPEQAAVIAEASGKAVLCPAAGRVFRPAPKPPPEPAPRAREAVERKRRAKACPHRRELTAAERDGCGCNGAITARCAAGRSRRDDGRVTLDECMACGQGA